MNVENYTIFISLNVESHKFYLSECQNSISVHPNVENHTIFKSILKELLLALLLLRKPGILHKVPLILHIPYFPSMSLQPILHKVLLILQHSLLPQHVPPSVRVEKGSLQTSTHWYIYCTACIQKFTC